MKKMISFIVKAEKGFLKKPDINDGIYLTYNMLHKPAILGMLGAIIGLDGYKENGVLPEYYNKLKNIPIGVKPIGDEKGNFQKTVITYNNTTGFASHEDGGNLIITEQTLIKPSYKIYLLLDLEEDNQKKLYRNIKSQEADYLPYLGKNDYSLWWNKEEVEEYDWEIAKNNNEKEISSIFEKKEYTVKDAKVDSKEDFDLLDFSQIFDKPRFVSFERLPIAFNTDLFQYNLADFAYTNFRLKSDISLKNLYFLNSSEYVQLN